MNSTFSTPHLTSAAPVSPYLKKMMMGIVRCRLSMHHSYHIMCINTHYSFIHSVNTHPVMTCTRSGLWPRRAKMVRNTFSMRSAE